MVLEVFGEQDNCTNRDYLFFFFVVNNISSAYKLRQTNSDVIRHVLCLEIATAVMQNRRALILFFISVIVGITTKQR